MYLPNTHKANWDHIADTSTAAECDLTPKSQTIYMKILLTLLR